MSDFPNTGSTRILLNGWVQDLAMVLESMTGQSPASEWRAGTGTPASLGLAAGPDTLWSLYKLRGPQQTEILVVAPRQVWEHVGSAVLQATGLQASGQDEIRKTWLEILAQWISALVRLLSAHLGSEVTVQEPENASGENASFDAIGNEAPAEWLLTTLRFGETELPSLAARFSPALAEILTAPADSQNASVSSGGEAGPLHTSAEIASASRALDLLLDVDLPVSISFGKTRLPLKDVLKLTTGSIVELNRAVNEPVEVLVNQCLVARGEVVVVEGNYGVRIQHLASREERLRSIR